MGTAVLVGVVAAACGGSGIPKQQHGETYAGQRGQYAGTIEKGDGCARLRLDDGSAYAVIWPASASTGNEGYVNLGWFQPDLGDGDRVEGTGALTPVADLPYWGESGYWPQVLGSCVKSGETDALVFDEARPASR